MGHRLLNKTEFAASAVGLTTVGSREREDEPVGASIQESFLSDMSRFSFGAFSLFEPDSYRKGSGWREPADLAWVSSGTVVLFYMQAGSGGHERHHEHNLRQARGWLRAWAGGKRMTGRNDSRVFDVALKDARDVVVVSVTGDRDSGLHVLDIDRGRLAADVDQRLVTAIAMSDLVLAALAQMGGSAVDFLDLLLRVATVGESVEPGAAVQMLVEQRDHSRSKALTSSRVRQDRDTELDETIYRGISTELRAGALRNSTPESAQFDALFETFGDLDWEMRFTLTLVIADMFRLVRDVPIGAVGPTVAGGPLELRPYHFFVAAYDVNKQATFSEQLFAAQRSFTAEHSTEPVVTIHAQMVGRPDVEFASYMISVTNWPAFQPVAADVSHHLRVLNEPDHI